MFQKLTICLVLACLSFSILAQDSLCASSNAQTFLHGNNVRALIRNNGSLFFDSTAGVGSYRVPFRGTNSPNPIFYAGLMMAGKDVVGNLRAASSLYYPTDFWSGILSPTNAFPSARVCQNWDKMWSVTGVEIKQHLADWRDNGRIDNPIPSILGFPARKNPHFLQQNGFELPNSTDGYAAFFDRNNDSIYNPLDSDYPRVEALAASVIPAQITWCVFNDNGNLHTAARFSIPLRMEVQLTTWALECVDTSFFLNNTIFASYRFLSRSLTRTDSLFVGLMADFDIDCEGTDNLGCDTINHCFYAYNRVRKGDSIQNCRQRDNIQFGQNPPAQAITFLNHPLSSFGYTLGSNLCDFYQPLRHPYNAFEVYNVLQGKWSDGTPITEGGSGYQTGGRVVKHAFSSSPFDTSKWFVKENRTLIPCPDEALAWGATSFGTFNNRQTARLDVAFSLHRDKNLDAWQNVSLLRNTEIPQLRAWYADSFKQACTPVTDCAPTDDCVWAGDANRDGIADYQDALPIAWAIGQGGAKRTGALRWSPKSGAAWNRSFPDGVNVKHVDCNADGKVSPSDFEITQAFYNSKRPDYRPNDRFTEGVDVQIESTANLDSLRFSNFVAAPLDVNLVSNLPDLVGLSFEMEFDPRYFHYNNAWFQANNGNPLGYLTPFQNRQAVKTVQFSVGLMDSTARLSPQRLLTFSVFRNRDSFPTWTTNTTFIRFKNMRGLFKDGSYRQLGGQTRRVRFAENAPLSISSVLDDNFLKVQPNPAQTAVQIEMTNAKSLKIIELYGISGKLVLRKNNLSTTQTVLEVGDLPRGFYVLRANTEGGVFIKKVILQ